jgi:hypothetical protein
MAFYLPFIFSIYSWGGRPVVHEKKLSDIVEQAEFIILGEFISSEETQDSNKCDILSHHVKVIDVIQPSGGLTFEINKKYRIGINPMWAQDCSLRKSMGGSGASFYAESFREGVDISQIKKGSRILYFIKSAGDPKIPWTLVMNGALLEPSKYFSESKINLPLKTEAWTVLSFNKIPKNSVLFLNDQLRVKVESSAGPIVHKLPRTLNISEFSIKGKISGTKKDEGKNFDEDSVLRFGLVAVGKKTLSGPKKWVAADWVKKLFELAPQGTGLDKIIFYNFTNRKDLIGQTRIHPKSELIVETLSFLQSEEGLFSIDKKLELPIDTAAIWISIDGDDTKSNFETLITEIAIKTQTK